MATRSGDNFRTALDDVRRGAGEAVEIGSSASKIAADIGEILKREMELAKAEMSEEASKAVRATVWTGVASLMAYFTVLFLLVAGMWGLAEIFDEMWINALIVAGGVFILAAITGMMAFARWKQFHVVPQKAIESSKETVNWASEQLKSNGR